MHYILHAFQWMLGCSLISDTLLALWFEAVPRVPPGNWGLSAQSDSARKKESGIIRVQLPFASMCQWAWHTHQFRSISLLPSNLRCHHCRQNCLWLYCNSQTPTALSITSAGDTTHQGILITRSSSSVQEIALTYSRGESSNYKVGTMSRSRHLLLPQSVFSPDAAICFPWLHCRWGLLRDLPESATGPDPNYEKTGSHTRLVVPFGWENYLIAFGKPAGHREVAPREFDVQLLCVKVSVCRSFCV